MFLNSFLSHCFISGQAKFGHHGLCFPPTTPSNLVLSNAVFDIGTSLDLSAVNAWSVSGNTLSASDLASNLFAISLVPYLALLYFLARPETKTPQMGNFGFQFLLAFVFATIPAGIYAKVAYHDILANVDWLHGGAESLLTITNLLIVFGFRNARKKNDAKVADSLKLNSSILPFILLALSYLGLTFPPHIEPANALSLPTWCIHSSSIIEWLLAMQYIFEHADVSDNPRWKGMAWGMLPSHASGICACTFHFL